MTEERYDIKASTRSVHELYPVIKDAHGNVIDGFHRLRDVPEWRTETLDYIRTPTQLWLARIIANTHRRKVSREERSTQIGELARSLVKNEKVPREEIVSTIAELTTFSEDYIRRLLPDEYKIRPGVGGAATHRVGFESYSEVAVPAGTPGSPVSMESPPTSTEEKEAPVPLEGDVTDVTTTPDTPVTPPESPLQDYITDTYSHLLGADESWLRDVLEIKFRLSDREARDEIRRYKGRQSPLAEAEAKPEPRKARYTPPKPERAPTCRCPLCGRDGGDKNLILARVEDPQVAQLTLGEFIREAFRR